MTDPKELELFILSMIKQPYELNDIIPNIEMLFFKMFCSPVTTKEIRKKSDRENLMAGNIFMLQDFNMPTDGYKSLLQTVSLHPKKKHLKKIIQHLQQCVEPKDVDPELIDMIVTIGIDSQYPILLGHKMKHYIQNGYSIEPNTFVNFYMFLERCKGFEDDARRFVFLSSQTENLKLDYDLCRPLFLRTMNMKSGSEVLKLFEQFRKNIKLNKAQERDLSEEDKYVAMKDTKNKFYDGLTKDLLEREAYPLAQIIYGEKTREKSYKETLDDEITGMIIFSAQNNMPDYREKYYNLMDDESQYRMTESIAEAVGNTLVKFNLDEQRNERIVMAEKLEKNMFLNRIFMTAKTLHNLCFIYTEA